MRAGYGYGHGSVSTRLTYMVLSRHRPLRDYYSNNFAFEDGKNHHMVRYVLHRVSASSRSFSLWIGRTDPVGERTSVWPSSQSLWKWAQSAPLGVVFRAVKTPRFRDRFEVKCLQKNLGNSLMRLRELHSFPDLTALTCTMSKLVRLRSS